MFHQVCKVCGVKFITKEMDVNSSCVSCGNKSRGVVIPLSRLGVVDSNGRLFFRATDVLELVGGLKSFLCEDQDIPVGCACAGCTRFSLGFSRYLGL